jgi:hypothetical protein
MAHVAKYQKSALGRMVGHYERSAEKHGYERDNIDNSRIGEDYNLAPKDVDPVQWIQGRIEALGKKPRKNSVMMCDCVITAPEEVSDDELRRFFEAEDAALAKAFGRQNVIGAWVHLDEPGARPHMHWAWVPVTQDGRLSARDVVSRTALRALHPALQKAADDALGHHVQILLDDGRKAEKYVGLDEYKKATGEARRAAERASEAKEKAATAERAQKAAEARKTAAETSQVHVEAKLRGLMDSVAKKQTQAADLDSEIARKMDQKTSLQAEISRFSEKRENAEAETARLKQETAFARIELDNVRNDLEQDKAEIRMVEGMSYRDADGNTRLGIKGMERAYIESQERMKAAKEQEKACAAQAAQAKADAKAWQAQADMQQRRLGMKPLKFVSTLRTVCIQIAEDCLELWRYAKDAARRRWNRWMDKGLGDCADTFGVTYIEAVETAEQALHKTAVAQHLEQAEKDLLRGPEDGQEIGIYQQRW